MSQFKFERQRDFTNIGSLRVTSRMGELIRGIAYKEGVSVLSAVQTLLDGAVEAYLKETPLTNKDIDQAKLRYARTPRRKPYSEAAPEEYATLEEAQAALEKEENSGE